jgi:hypothetical protein
MVFSMDWEIKIISDWNIIYSHDFQEKWQKIISDAYEPHVFFHPSLCMAWIDTYKPLRSLSPLFCLAKLGEINLFLPLVIWKQNWKNIFRKIIVPVGFSDFDYHDPLINIEMDQRYLIDFYNQLISKIKNISSFDEIIITGIRDLKKLQLNVKDCNRSLFIDLRRIDSEEDLLKNLKASLRGDIKRQKRRIEEIGTIQLHRFNTLEESHNILSEFLKMHSSRWPESYKANKFHHSLLIHGFGSKLINFSALKAGNQVLSYHLGFEFNQCFYYYMPIINPRYEKLSPGKIHLFELLMYAINNKIVIFDFLLGDENYKKNWANNSYTLHEIHFQNENWKSKLRAYGFVLKSYLKKAV